MNEFKLDSTCDLKPPPAGTSNRAANTFLLSELDRAYESMERGEVARGMRELLETLRHERATQTPEDWRRTSVEICRQHPIRHLVHQDPFTLRSFEKPRRYSGDAVLLDFMYEGLEACHANPSPIGKQVYEYLSKQRSTIGLLGRLQMLAQWIDDVSARVPAARIFSVACGHLREAQCSRAVRERRFGEFLALDQDLLSLEFVRNALAGLGIKPVSGSVKALLREELTFADLDLVYAAGLYDYLGQSVAVRFTRRLFSMLRSGGRLLLANYADPPEDSGFKAYMEAMMDWWLIYREESELWEWTREIPGREMAWQRVFKDATENVVYLELCRV